HIHVRIVVAAILLCISRYAQADPAAPELILRGPETPLGDFPIEALARPPAGADDTSYIEWLKSRPALVLDGTTLRIGQPGAAPSLSIRVSRFELRHGSRIITNGGDLEISAPSIVSEDGVIRAFDSRVTPTAQDRKGVPGIAGLSGGRV